MILSYYVKTALMTKNTSCSKSYNINYKKTEIELNHAQQSQKTLFSILFIVRLAYLTLAT